MDALSEEKVTGTRVVEFFPIVALDRLDTCVKLSGDMGDELSQRAESVRFESQRKCPQVMSAVIKNNQIIFITRNTDNWGSPQITVNKIKLI
jgi:hypothetical protein